MESYFTMPLTFNTLIVAQPGLIATNGGAHRYWLSSYYGSYEGSIGVLIFDTLNHKNINQSDLVLEQYGAITFLCVGK